MSVGADAPEISENMRALLSALVLTIPASEASATVATPVAEWGAERVYLGVLGCPGAGFAGQVQTDGPARREAKDEPEKGSNRDKDEPSPEPPMIRVMIARN